MGKRGLGNSNTMNEVFDETDCPISKYVYICGHRIFVDTTPDLTQSWTILATGY